jgi:hypothetical protein
MYNCQEHSKEYNSWFCDLHTINCTCKVHGNYVQTGSEYSLELHVITYCCSELVP